MSSNTGWIVSLVVLVVAVCAALAAMGFKGRISTVGVDLGTTFSVVGVNRGGKVSIVTDTHGHNIFPSIVSYQENGEILVGYQAAAQLSAHPQNTIYNAKRFIGRSLADAEVQQYASEHPFQVVESRLSNYSQVGFKISAGGHPAVVTPEQVGTQVLKFLLGLTANFLGHNQVNKAVIAVPAKFSALQRQATGEAYRQAGLKVVRVMEEPTAAAVAYRLHKRTDIHHILVYDFGGGTLDVSLLYVAKGSVEVYATDGDETLGGSDLDLCLYRTLKDRIWSMTGLEIADYTSTSTPANTVSTGSAEGGQAGSSGVARSSLVAAEDRCDGPAVLQRAEQIKKQLTSATVATFRCSLSPGALAAGARVAHQQGEQAEGKVVKGVKEQGQQQVVEFQVRRVEDFEQSQSCAPLFRRAMLPVTRLLDSLEMMKDDVDEVVLVGGSTRVPLVKQQLRDYFQKDLNDRIDPDVTVAYGAASILD